MNVDGIHATIEHNRLNTNDLGTLRMKMAIGMASIKPEPYIVKVFREQYY